MLDGIGYALGVRRVLLVGGRVPRVDSQTLRGLDHVARSVNHREAGGHDGLLRLARLRADLGRDTCELRRRGERVEVLDGLDERLGGRGALQPVTLREVTVQNLEYRRK